MLAMAAISPPPVVRSSIGASLGASLGSSLGSSHAPYDGGHDMPTARFSSFASQDVGRMSSVDAVADGPPLSRTLERNMRLSTAASGASPGRPPRPSAMM